jgi:hypothetical protein
MTESNQTITSTQFREAYQRAEHNCATESQLASQILRKSAALVSAMTTLSAMISEILEKNPSISGDRLTVQEDNILTLNIEMADTARRIREACAEQLMSMGSLGAVFKTIAALETKIEQDRFERVPFRRENMDNVIREAVNVRETDASLEGLRGPSKVMMDLMNNLLGMPSSLDAINSWLYEAGYDDEETEFALGRDISIGGDEFLAEKPRARKKTDPKAYFVEINGGVQATNSPAKINLAYIIALAMIGARVVDHHERRELQIDFEEETY